ncbi:hypothetical protein E4U53_007154 [Claviceps sorghi]|nr:hypothetical protein E4U53_007154 [Claviceps sorghi]
MVEAKDKSAEGIATYPLEYPTLTASKKRKVSSQALAMMDLPGYRIVQVLGTVYGISVRSRNLAASLGMVLKSL